jgi:hypothetical protein
VDIAALINRIGANKRRFAGASYTSRFPLSCSGFSGEIELLRSDDDIYFEGGFITADGEVPHHFKFSIPFKSMSTAGGHALLTAAPIGELRGPLLSTTSGFEFIGEAGALACSLHLRLVGREDFVVSGMIRFATHQVAFSAEAATQWERSSQAKVVSIHSRATRSDA